MSVGNNIPTMPSCNHEEADTQLVVHILHTLEQGLKSIEVRTIDTDVIVILVGAFVELTRVQPLADIWIAFGMGKDFRFYSLNALCSALGDSRSRALPVFHALTGCDTTSAFRGKGKKSAWQAWQAFSEVTETFQYLADHPFEHLSAESGHFRKIERLIVILFDKKVRLVLQIKQGRNCLSQKLKYGQDTTHSECTTSAHTTGSLPSWNLDNQHSGTASSSITRRVCLDKNSNFTLAASLDDYS